MSSTSLTSPQLEEQSSKPQCFPPSSQIDSSSTLQRAGKVNAAYETDPVTTQYYRRFDDSRPQCFPHSGQSNQYSSSIFSDGFKELSNEEMRHIYQNSSLTEEVGSTLNPQKGVVSIEVCFQVPLRCLRKNKCIARGPNHLIAANSRLHSMGQRVEALAPDSSVPLFQLLASGATGSI